MRENLLEKAEIELEIYAHLFFDDPQLNYTGLIGAILESPFGRWKESTIKTVLNRMIENEWIKKQIYSDDIRVHYYFPTREGKERFGTIFNYEIDYAEKIGKEIRKKISDLFSDFPGKIRQIAETEIETSLLQYRIEFTEKPNGEIMQRIDEIEMLLEGRKRDVIRIGSITHGLIQVNEEKNKEYGVDIETESKKVEDMLKEIDDWPSMQWYVS